MYQDMICVMLQLGHFGSSCQLAKIAYTSTQIDTRAAQCIVYAWIYMINPWIQYCNYTCTVVSASSAIQLPRTSETAAWTCEQDYPFPIKRSRATHRENQAGAQCGCLINWRAIKRVHPLRYDALLLALRSSIIPQHTKPQQIQIIC
jgi:hypothetical protein